ncbi:MAG: response regulator transcription factor [Chryseosolibacter sp.]
MAAKRILIADDHFAIRIGIKHLLKNEFASVEFGEATNAQEVFEKIKSGPWDVMILDINMPGGNGFEVLKQLRDEKQVIPVLVFSMHREEIVALRALKAGASGYLSKDAADTELAKAIHQLLAGRKYISHSVAELMVSQLDNPENRPSHELLSDREYQTLLLIASGRTVSQIADELSLGISTISTYRVRILEKMGFKNNAELTHYAIEHRLI